MIILDTNQLFYAKPGMPILAVLNAAAGRTGHTLATTDVVLWEAARQYRDKITAGIGQLRKAYVSLTGALSPRVVKSLPQLPDVGAEVAAYEASIRRSFTILETTGEDALEAIRREALRLPPCKQNGEGGRDTTIWLTALRAAKTPDVKNKRTLPTLLVSADDGFGDGASMQLNEALAQEAVVAGASITLCDNIVSTLTVIGTPTVPVDPSDIGNRPEVLLALSNAAATVFMKPLGGESSAEQVEYTFPTGMITASPPGKFVRVLAQPHSCELGDYVLTCITGEWRFRYISFDRAAPKPSWITLLALAATALPNARAGNDFEYRVVATVVVGSQSGHVVHAQTSGVTVDPINLPRANAV